MARPWASVIIPTHDRAATLDVTLDSLRAQSVTDIEIVIAGDGVTGDVRAIAEAAVANDPRVRFLDQPKGIGRGFANRHRALEETRAERIFYTDDDDLWLPDHVARLGAALDDAEVADSATLSLARSGRLQRCWLNQSHPAQRGWLADGGLKLVFDTHLAHRRSLYDRLGPLWEQGVTSMLTAFAASDARWVTVNAVTALSIHGSVRRLFSPAERRDEIIDWSRRLQRAAGGAAVGADASPVWYLLEMASTKVRRPIAEDTLESFLARGGIAPDGVGLGEIAMGGQALWPPMSAKPRGEADMVIDLLAGRASAEGNAFGTTILSMMEPLLSPVAEVQRLVRILRRSFTSKHAIRLVSAITPEHAGDDELIDLLVAECHAAFGNPDRARAMFASGNRPGKRYAPDAALGAARFAERDGRGDDQIATLRGAFDLYGARSDIRMALAEGLYARGETVEAARLAEGVLALDPMHRRALRLSASIEAPPP